MYLEIDEGYFEHPKTLDLCARLKDSKACVYPLRLWKWACRSAKSGKLGKVAAFAIEKVVGYETMDGACFLAMCETGFVDRHDDGSAEIHDWMEYTGGAIERMEAEARRKKEYRDSRRAKPAASADCPADILGTNTTKTRPVQTSQDPDPLSSLEASESDPEESTPRAISGYSWLAFFRAQWWKSKGRQYGQGEADAKACARLGELIQGLPEAERAEDWKARDRIVAEFLGRADAQTAGSGWSFSFFASGFNGLRIPPEARPKPAERPGQPKQVVWR